MNKKKLFKRFIIPLYFCFLGVSLFSLSNNFIKSNAFNNLIEENACTTPDGYEELDEVLKKAYVNEGLNFSSNEYKRGTESYKTFGTITCINTGSDAFYDIYLERISPKTRIKSGLYIYGASLAKNYHVGQIIGVNGTFLNYYGSSEFILNEEPVSLSEYNSYGNVTPRIFSSNLASNFTYLDQATLVKLENVSISQASSATISINKSSYYCKGKINESEINFKVYTRDVDKTNEIGKYMYDAYQNSISLDIVGNVTFHENVYKIDIGSIEDISEHSSGHKHTYSSYSYDATKHWKQCTCGHKIEISNHISSDWIIDVEATQESDGKKHKECKVCYYVIESTTFKYSDDNGVIIDIYAFNDTHENVMDTSTSAGIAKTATYIKNKRKENPNTIVLSSGDMWQGSMYSNNTKGKLMSEWLNELGCSSMTLGNHEFDWFDTAIKENIKISNFPYLGINILSNDTSSRVDYLNASTTLEIDGFKIGIIGAIGNCYSSISGSRVRDIRFAIYDELTKLVQDESNRLRNVENCDYIIYSFHSSQYGYDTDLSTGGYVDISFEGHSHSQYTTQDSGGVYHLQGKGYNQSFSHAKIKVDPTTKEVSYLDVTPINTSTLLDLEDDANTLAIIDKYSSEIGNPDEIIGYNSKLRDSDELREIVAELYLKQGLKEWGDSYDIALAGGYMSVRSPHNLPIGNVTVSAVYNLFPFDNDLTVSRANGSFISSCYVNSTNSNYFTAYNSPYSKSYDYLSSSLYYLVCDTYGSDFYVYGNGYRESYQFEEVVKSTSNKYARDLLMDYIKEGNLSI